MCQILDVILPGSYRYMLVLVMISIRQAGSLFVLGWGRMAETFALRHANQAALMATYFRRSRIVEEEIRYFYLLLHRTLLDAAETEQL